MSTTGIAVCGDIRDGLALDSESIDYAVSIHALQDLAYPDVVPALGELRRVLRPGGVLRLGVPDLERAIIAYLRADHAYFYVPDAHARSIGAKLVTQIVWYGSARTPFTFDFAAEALTTAGFTRVRRTGFRMTKSRFPEIVALDNRERETLYVEAWR